MHLHPVLRIRINIKLKCRIRIRIKVISWIRIRDQVPFYPLDPGWVKSKNRVRDEHPRSESLETFLVKIHKFFNADADPGIFLTPDPGLEKFGSGIRVKHPGSATLASICR
jgi:hypothetical protein